MNESVHKMKYNKAQELIFSRKSHSAKHPDLYFSSLVVEKLKIQKHLGLKLDEKLNFKGHLKDKFAIRNWYVQEIKQLPSTPLLGNSLKSLCTTSFTLR